MADSIWNKILIISLTVLFITLGVITGFTIGTVTGFAIKVVAGLHLGDGKDEADVAETASRYPHSEATL